jgi:hypothetical protein
VVQGEPSNVKVVRRTVVAELVAVGGKARTFGSAVALKSNALPIWPLIKRSECNALRFVWAENPTKALNILTELVGFSKANLI